MKLTDTAQTILEARYFVGEEEAWDELCSRVATAISNNETNDGAWYDEFFDILYEQKFLPNSPCLMNAGTDIGQLCACFVLPVEDSMEGIFNSIKNAALVNKTGGGTGFSFSRLRPKNSTVKSTNGVASGPVSFIKVFNAATEAVKQGGRRRGANMGVLRVDHPDILEFIKAKETEGELSNFNLSVAVTDEFMQAIKDNGFIDLIDPQTKKVVDSYSAPKLWDLIISKAHSNGEPGILFIDTANKYNPTPWLGDFESPNPCAEQWLLPYEACNLGSINLEHFVKEGKVDYDELERVTRIAVRFMDNVVDVSTFPIPEIEEATRKTRKLGLGIMGLHDMLIQMKIPYDSSEGRRVAARVMSHIKAHADVESQVLSDEKGVYPALKMLKYGSYPHHKRNAALTSIQPTGTVSMIADCSSGCEPYFSVVTKKNVMDGKEFILVNKHFERIAKKEGWYSDELMNKVAETGTEVGHNEIPKEWQNIFKCAQDISVDGHIRMQAVLQPYVDASISKTINMPNSASIADVKEAYMLGWELGCKGLTVYRDGSRDVQVLTSGSSKKKEEIVTAKGCSKAELPDTLNSKRFRLRGKDNESVYVIICYDDYDEPLEVFAKFPYENQPDLLEKRVLWTTVCRLISLALRYGIPSNEVIKQLNKSSGVINDLPAQLSNLLKVFDGKLESTWCPECSYGKIIFTEGCMKCDTCGWSKCG